MRRSRLPTGGSKNRYGRRLALGGSGRRPYRTQPVPRLLKVAGQARGNLSVALEDSGSLASYLRTEERELEAGGRN